MNAANPTKAPRPHTDASASTRDWVEALANGSCDSAEFLRHMRQQGRDSYDEIWEALALLDQAFRSRRIERDTFMPIKSDLQRFALGREGGAAAPRESTIPRLSPIETPVAARAPATAQPASQPASPAPIRIGTLLRGRYRVIGVLGKSTKGTVVEAIDEMRAGAPDIMQRIAIRILDAHDLQESGQMSAYLRHVCKLQTLSHPNLLRVFDFDQDEGRPFLTMELLSGSRLPQFIAPTASALKYKLDRRHVLRCIAGALQCAHAQGIAHGDLCAEEIFITLTGDVRLMGLDGAFNRTADDIGRDQLAFARLVRELLGERAHSGQLRSEAEGERLLQRFVEPERATPAEEIYAVPYIPMPTIRSEPFGRSGGKAKWVWSLLMLGLVGAAGYIVYGRPDLMSYLMAPSPGTVSVTAPPAVSAAPQAAASGKRSDPESMQPNAGNTTGRQIAAAAPEVAPVPSRSIIFLAQEALRVEDSNALARVRVMRQGNTARSASFVWWTENGSAEPGVDFYAVTPRGESFPANSSSVDLFVPLIPTASHDEPVTFYVKIDEAGTGAILGQRTLAQVSIVPPGYVSAPVSEETAR